MKDSLSSNFPDRQPEEKKGQEVPHLPREGNDFFRKALIGLTQESPDLSTRRSNLLRLLRTHNNLQEIQGAKGEDTASIIEANTALQERLSSGEDDKDLALAKMDLLKLVEDYNRDQERIAKIREVHENSMKEMLQESRDLLKELEERLKMPISQIDRSNLLQIQEYLESEQRCLQAMLSDYEHPNKNPHGGTPDNRKK